MTTVNGATIDFLMTAGSAISFKPEFIAKKPRVNPGISKIV